MKMAKTRFYLLLTCLIAFVPVLECSIFSSILDIFGLGKDAILTRTCFQVPKNLHQSILSNDCQSVQNDPSKPINKLVNSQESDSLKKPFSENIDASWKLANFYKSPYNGNRTGLRFSFAISYDDEPLENRLLNPVEPFRNYKNNSEKNFAVELTKLFITGKSDNNLKTGKFVLKKKVKPSFKIPKFIRCNKPVSIKIRFYTMELTNNRDVDYMYMIYAGKIKC